MNPALNSSKKMNWGTPDSVFAPLNVEFDFGIDLAATENNTKCEEYFSPGQDSLAQDWAIATKSVGWGWLNPEYGRALKRWVQKAAEERTRGANVVMLIPARTDTKYWHAYIWDKAVNRPREGVEVRFLEGRIAFIDPDTGLPGDAAPFPSAVIVFRAA